ncbi:MAG: hypothetical protein ACNA7Y_02680 [Gammaproteobacteria bacterium]
MKSFKEEMFQEEITTYNKALEALFKLEPQSILYLKEDDVKKIYTISFDHDKIEKKSLQKIGVNIYYILQEKNKKITNKDIEVFSCLGSEIKLSQQAFVAMIRLLTPKNENSPLFFSNTKEKEKPTTSCFDSLKSCFGAGPG